jgi:hypothetical protein
VRLDDREQTVVVEAADRRALEWGAAAAVVEGQDGAAARCVGRERRHRAEHRIVVVLTRHDEPQIDSFAPHELRQDRIETPRDPLADERRLLTVGEDPVAGDRRLSNRGGERTDDNQEADEHAHAWTL